MAAGLRAAVHTSGGQVLTKERWVRASCPGTNRTPTGATRWQVLRLVGACAVLAAVSSGTGGRPGVILRPVCGRP
ncbi:hypothetical protein [Streptomyces sp. NPDC050548]|uniref:hypothetical protein n=1 Tax=Streptomyces sp. NPDC050548 TaxID=3365629 RepID=UPI0037B6CB6E